MRSRYRPGTRATATLGAFGLTVGLAVAIPGSAARADDPSALLAAALADPASAASDTLDPGIVAELPHDLTFTLSPELAVAFGTSTLNEDQAKALLAQRGTPATPGRSAAATPEVGTTRMWPAIDSTPNTPTAVPQFGLYLKEYTLQAKEPNVEIWVASGSDDISTGTQFPAGDCRAKAGDPTVVTRKQAEGLADEFQNKMLPVESKFFSIAPSRDGSLSPGQLSPLGLDFTGSGDSTVTLIDNVRDANFYDFENNRSYVAGFFAGIFNQITDRNVMTVDAFDWIHRTGANPKNEPSADFCKSRPARPHLYEGVFAHEYQHLLQSYISPTPVPLNLPLRAPGLYNPEELWVNEGLSDMAPLLVGYSDPSRNVRQKGAESHLFCFLGDGEIKGPANPNPVYCGGPENSLTVWEDQVKNGPSALLADYGNVWAFMIFLLDRYGPDFISALHRDPGVGLAGLQDVLDARAGGTKAMDVLHDFQLMILLDNAASAKGAKLVGEVKSAITDRRLRAAANYRYRGAYEQPGAAPNGADYVLLRKGGKEIPGNRLSSLVFAGPKTVGGPDGPPVENWLVRLVGLDAKGKRVLVRTFDSAYALSLGAGELKAFAGYKTVIAVVSADDLAGRHTSYLPYTLTVNGEKQLGGS